MAALAAIFIEQVSYALVGEFSLELHVLLALTDLLVVGVLALLAGVFALLLSGVSFLESLSSLVEVILVVRHELAAEAYERLFVFEDHVVYDVLVYVVVVCWQLMVLAVAVAGINDI